MDSFTWAVIVGDLLMAAAFVALIVLDKPQPAVPVEAPKPTGKR